MPLPRKQLRQLGEVDLQPARLVPREQIGSRAPAGLLLIVEIAELLSVLVADDEAGVYSSRRWSRAAGSGGGMSRLLRPVVKPRNLVCRTGRGQFPFMTASAAHTKGSEGGFDLVYALVLRARDEAKCSFGRLNNDGAG